MERHNKNIKVNKKGYEDIKTIGNRDTVILMFITHKQKFRWINSFGWRADISQVDCHRIWVRV